MSREATEATRVMNIVLLGPPGAGKGTQGARLSERCGIGQYATGEILREEVRQNSDLGREAKAYMDRGELVPDDVILGMIAGVLARVETGFILDGFPRTVPQAEGFERLLDAEERTLDVVIYFDVSEQELLRRLRGRLVCANCKTVFNLRSDPPRVEGVCDRCGGRLEQRSDDKEEATLVNRLRVYRESTEPLLVWYEARGVPLHRLDATGTVDEVTEKLLGVVGCS